MKKARISDLEKGQDVTIHLKNGEVLRGIFQFIDGDEFDGDLVLKPIDPNSKTPMLGWDTKWINKVFIND